ncbi:hypothetical protein ED733_002808 [Metarhizium rileyi]|uniref:Mitochondrial chaperone bcs1 n=1 Tax=Metarhizium rileyi (strain RCEF 4871) TaxID=1649241 RepID=A0A5C6G7T9_METRR|nr:hypothetical protein ED733_002808 [Metarhizium rileyi]
MDFQLPQMPRQAAQNSSAPNDSGPTGSGDQTGPFPGVVVDSFLATAGRASPLMQLVLFLYQALASRLGLNPSLLLTFLGTFWGVTKVGHQCYALVANFIDRHFMCAMYVSEHDPIHGQLMRWLSHQQSVLNGQYLMAQTVVQSAWEDEEELESALFITDGGDKGSGHQYLNFSNQAARSSPRFVPAWGVTSFWHKGTYFRVQRKREAVLASSGWGPMKDQDEMRISCFGRSLGPVKKLLIEAKESYFSDTRKKTTIHRPEFRDRGFNHIVWKQMARRPVRPMRTVMLAEKEKRSIMADMNEYFHPETPRWYASRGIPLRRGYLFHGPPGTGKTSFSFALAGVFGVDIYVINLQDADVTDASLLHLFNKLPRRCVVLLEDIDTAGLNRDSDSGGDKTERRTTKSKSIKKNSNKNDVLTDSSKSTDKKKSKSTTNSTPGNSSKERKKDGDGSAAESAGEDDDSDDSSDDSNDDGQQAKSKQIVRKTATKRAAGDKEKMTGSSENLSLAGVLNAIDGVASHEGRVLIMTTNVPESLDEALIRPGRVDVQVAFKNASSQQAGELFCRMYETVSHAESTNRALSPKDNKDDKPTTETAMQSNKPGLDADNVESLSKRFAHKIPDDLCSPAEIQGFLLCRKRDPLRALRDVDGWVEGLIKKKECGSKVMTVQ